MQKFEYTWMDRAGRNREGDKFQSVVMVHSSGRILARIVCPVADEYWYSVHFTCVIPSSLLSVDHQRIDLDFFDVESAQRFIENILERFNPTENAPTTLRAARRGKKTRRTAALGGLMTIPEFIKALGSISEGGFYLNDNNRLRFRSDIDLCMSYMPCMCPLTIVCYLQTGVFYSPVFWQAAANLLDIVFEDAVKILRAADNIACAGLTTEEQGIRKELLVAAGLKEGCL